MTEKGTKIIVVRLNNGEKINFTGCGIDFDCNNNYFVFKDDEGNIFGIIPRENVVCIIVDIE